MKILVLGSEGMLGRYLINYFEDKFDCIGFNREILDLTSDRKTILSQLSQLVKKGDLIINSAGIIKQRNYDIVEMISVNSILPNILNELKIRTDCKVIHITTDCVYSGEVGFYDEDSIPDANDEYGRTKILGENPNNMNIRTSIIGEEKKNKKSLIEWVKSNQDKKILGFDNHIWNGVTCLELCKFIHEVIKKDSYWIGTKHIHSSDDISKYELVKIINEIYNLNIEIEKTKVNRSCYRNLRTKYDFKIYKSIYEQITEQKNFLLK